MDDFTVSVRQLGQYPLTDVIGAGDLLLVQKGGLGGPYASATAAVLFNGLQSLNIGLSPPAFARGITANFFQAPLGARFFFNAYVDQSGIQRYLQNGVAGQWSFDATGLTFAIAPWGALGTQMWPASSLFTMTPDGQLTLQRSIEVGRGPILDNEVATKLWTELNTVASFNGRTGAVCLTADDLGAAICLQPGDAIATQCYVNETINAAWQQWYTVTPLVFTFMGRVGDITLTDADVTFACTAPGAMPRTSTPPPGDISTRIANCAFVAGEIDDLYEQIGNDIGNAVTGNYAPINSPQFTGVPTAPTANPGSSTGQLATTAFVQAAIVASTTGVSSFNTRTGAIVLEAADISNATGALINSPAFTGVPTAPTATPGNSSTAIATTAFVQAALAAFVPSSGVTSFNTRSGAVVLNTADITGAGGAPNASPGLTGVPTAPTAAPGNSTTQLATTAFVQAAITAMGAGVTSFNGRSGAVNLQANDVSAVGGALTASPNFTGNPTAPTQTTGTSNTTLATTAFVQAAITSVAAGVTTFNGRNGAVVLTTADVTGVGSALLASPNFSGVPTAPTAAQTSNDTTLATTAFVKAAISGAALVSSFNGRNGAVTLQGADVSGAGGALIASPTFTGTPAGPTAVAGTSTTQLATTAFVQAALATSGGVNSFNGRAGAVTLTSADLVGATGALLTVANAAPTGAPATANSALWWDTVSGQLFLNYNDGNSTQWVVANVASPPSSLPPGVTDGSSAQPGQIGEYIDSSDQTVNNPTGNTPYNVATIALSAGDWDVYGYCLAGVTSGPATLINAQAEISPTSLTFANGRYTWYSGNPSYPVTVISNSLPMLRVSISASATIYLVAQSGYSTNPTSWVLRGALWARRVR